ncbi:MAG: glycosyltransferase family 9 protein [Syntrophobacterales bacterium]
MRTFPHLPSHAVQKILVWHQGSLGDLLLAGPALVAVSRTYSETQFIGVGQPGCWRLLDGTLPLAAAWDGGEALWAGLYQEQGDLSPRLVQRLAGVDLALVFSPKSRPAFLARLNLGGVPQAVWIPSFPEDGADHVVTVQARRLQELGIKEAPAPLRLLLAPAGGGEESIDPGDRLLVIAPGSASPVKNWPLDRYYELARALAWEAGLQVVWLAGPAEESLLPFIQGLAAAQEQLVWVQEPLERVARLLARTRVYLGGDSGMTHLAAAAGSRRVVALFGPTDPRVWAPLGEQVSVLTPPGGAGPHCSLSDLPAAPVLAEVRRFL